MQQLGKILLTIVFHVIVKQQLFSFTLMQHLQTLTKCNITFNVFRNVTISHISKLNTIFIAGDLFPSHRSRRRPQRSCVTLAEFFPPLYLSGCVLEFLTHTHRSPRQC